MSSSRGSSYKAKRQVLIQYFDLSEREIGVCLICKCKNKKLDPSYKTPRGKPDNLYKHLKVHEKNGDINLGSLFKKPSEDDDGSNATESEDGIMNFLEDKTPISFPPSNVGLFEIPRSNAGLFEIPHQTMDHSNGLMIEKFELNSDDLKQWLINFKESIQREKLFSEVKKYLSGEMLLAWYEFRETSNDFETFEHELLRKFYPKNRRCIFRNSIKQSDCETSAQFLINQFNSLSIGEAPKLAFYLHEDETEANQFLENNDLEILNERKKLTF